MWNKILNTPLVYLYLPLGVLISITLGFLFSNKILLPLLNISFAYPVMFSLLSQSRRERAISTMLFWALCLGFLTVMACVYFPARAAASILHGMDYVHEMFQWIRTGAGAEGDPLKFVPEHLLHFVIFSLLSVLTGSILSLFMGAVLMNYMSFYVGSLILASSDKILASLMGWHPWSIIRVASFVILGVLLSEPLICRFTNRKYNYSGARLYLWLALIGLVVDIILKSLLAPWWGLALRKLIS